MPPTSASDLAQVHHERPTRHYCDWWLNRRDGQQCHILCFQWARQSSSRQIGAKRPIFTATNIKSCPQVCELCSGSAPIITSPPPAPARAPSPRDIWTRGSCQRDRAGVGEKVRRRFHKGKGDVDNGRRASPPLVVLQENADRARMRRQAQRPGLHGVLGQADRGLAEKLDLIRSGDAVGNRRPGGEVWRLDRALILQDEAYAAQNMFAQQLDQSQATAVPGHVESIVIAGLDPAIHPFRKNMDARVKPAHDGGEQRFNSSGLRCGPTRRAAGQPALSHRGGESPP
jgi:hypothetical protein